MGLPAEIPDGAGSPEAGDASSQAVSQSILADVSASCVLSESVDSRDNQLDELVSLGSIGIGTNCLEQLLLLQIPICLGTILQILICL